MSKERGKGVDPRREVRVRESLVFARSAERIRQNDEPQLERLAELFSDEEVHHKAHKRTATILNPYKPHGYLEFLIHERGGAAHDLKQREKLADAEKAQAAASASKGMELLGKIVNDSELRDSFANVHPFQNIQIPTSFLNGLNGESRDSLALVRFVVEGMGQLQPDEIEMPPKELHQTKLELFASSVGFAQAIIVDPQRLGNDDLSKREKHTKRDAILSYGRKMLIANGQEGLDNYMLSKRSK